MNENPFLLIPPILQVLSLCIAALSLLTALIFGVYGFYDKKNERRRNFTISLLGNLSLNASLSESDLKMARRIRFDEKLTGDKIDEETDRCIINLLDYYEFLSTAYFDGLLDKKVLFHIRAGAMERAYKICEIYIEERRRIVDKDLYSNYLKFVEEYRKENPPPEINEKSSIEARIRQKYPDQTRKALIAANLLLEEKSVVAPDFDEKLFWEKLEAKVKKEDKK